ncbi:MAG: homoserine dehydrogenase, partial [Spirochaetales bacterium]|nr:homoserine dehydrogenase [Spirochaetales bacterium]
MKPVTKASVAVVGCGIVGGATAQLLLQDKESLTARSGVELNLKYIVDLDFTNARSLNLDASLFTDNLDAVLADPDVSIIVELIGG